MYSWLVTIRAILGYLAKAREAQNQFNEAAADMKKAAEDLCSKWEGDAATAFAKEQGVFNNWCGMMDNTASEYMTKLQETVSKYEETESTVQQVIGSK